MAGQRDDQLEPLRNSTRRETAEEYGIAAIRGLIGAVPFAGTALNEVLFDARSRIQHRRLQRFVEELAHDMRALEASSLDREFLESEEFSDLAAQVFARVARNRSDAKRAHFRQILVGGLTGVRSPDFSTLFLNLLEEMTEHELAIYSHYYRIYLILRERRTSGKELDVKVLDYSADEIMGLAPAAFKQVVQSLIRKGLLFDNSYQLLDTEPFTIVELTELGAAFFEWVGRAEAEKARRELVESEALAET